MSSRSALRPYFRSHFAELIGTSFFGRVAATVGSFGSGRAGPCPISGSALSVVCTLPVGVEFDTMYRPFRGPPLATDLVLDFFRDPPTGSGDPFSDPFSGARVNVARSCEVRVALISIGPVRPLVDRCDRPRAASSAVAWRRRTSKGTVPSFLMVAALACREVEAVLLSAVPAPNGVSESNFSAISANCRNGQAIFIRPSPLHVQTKGTAVQAKGAAHHHAESKRIDQEVRAVSRHGYFRHAPRVATGPACSALQTGSDQPAQARLEEAGHHLRRTGRFCDDRPRALAQENQSTFIMYVECQSRVWVTPQRESQKRTPKSNLLAQPNPLENFKVVVRAVTAIWIVATAIAHCRPSQNLHCVGGPRYIFQVEVVVHCTVLNAEAKCTARFLRKSSEQEN